MKDTFRTALRVLFFRASRDELLALDRRHLIFGLFCTWIVGMGRWWDDLGARLLQHMGLGSLIYVFVLSLLIWAIAWPLREGEWPYGRLLTYITLTSPPAILYALPVERWTSMETATSLNLWFLVVVAIWRVALLVRYFRLAGGFGVSATVLATLVPLMLIITTLAILNLERAVLQFMSGFRQEPTSKDAAYTILVMLTALNFYGAIPAVGLYLFETGNAHVRRVKAKAVTDSQVLEPDPGQ